LPPRWHEQAMMASRRRAMCHLPPRLSIDVYFHAFAQPDFNDFDQGAEFDIRFVVLDPGNVIFGGAAPLGQLFLRQSSLFPRFFQQTADLMCRNFFSCLLCRCGRVFQAYAPAGVLVGGIYPQTQKITKNMFTTPACGGTKGVIVHR
jgi:hypothetical protein